MNRYGLLFDSPPWLILVGLLLGLGYAAVLYYRIAGPWSRQMNYLLAFLRFMLVVQLALLLFGPLIRQIRNVYEPPSVVLALDNSASVAETADSAALVNLLERVGDLAEALNERGFTAEIRPISTGRPAETGTIGFDYNRSDLQGFLRNIQNDYESRNLGAVVLLSDGLFNLGLNPAYSTFPFRIHTVGLGDTLRRPDINISALQYNKIAYQGNRFPLVAEVNCTSLQGSALRLSVFDGSRLLEERSVDITKPEQFVRTSFLIEASEAGMRRYRVTASPVEGEFSMANNSRDAYIEVIEGRERILLAGASPHPDLKAIRAALQKTSNYEVITYIPGVLEDKGDDWNAVILHQPSDRSGRLRELEQELRQSDLPIMYILGRQTDIRAFNASNGLVEIELLAGGWDNAFPWLNREFSVFNLEEDDPIQVAEYPPLRVPFGEFTLLAPAEVLLYQRIGNVRSSKPLVVLQRGSGRRSALVLGEGIWQWRLQEYALREDQQTFDRFVLRTIQYLTARDDKRRFRVYPQRNEYYDHEAVIFDSEVYNEVYERIYGHRIDLLLRDEDGGEQAFSFLTSESNSRFRAGILPKGVYTYEARAEVMGKTEQATGTFSVADVQLEYTRLHADHNLLRNLAQENSGNFYDLQHLDELEAHLAGEKPVNKIYSSEDFLAIINMKWGLLVLILFASAEWFLRKYHGSY
jgi:hypothetical protein